MKNKITLIIVLLIAIYPGTTFASEYYYDSNGRLIGFERDGNYYLYSYDKNGNLISKRLDINGSFERDNNNNGLPDFWEVAWRNGTSTGYFAERAPYEPVDGSHILRLHNGAGDANSFQYVDSKYIPVIGGTAYEFLYSMRYFLHSGGTVGFGIIEYDENLTQTEYRKNVHSHGQWKWNHHSFLLETKVDTRYMKIRIYIGGEQNEYLDVDQVQVQKLDINGSFEKDDNTNGLPDFWEVAWRNGTSNGNFAERAPYEPMDGNYVLRLHNGAGDSNSFQYVDSNFIPVSGGTEYEFVYSMRYFLHAGGTVGFGIIEYDSNFVQIAYSKNVHSHGHWIWNHHSYSIETKPETRVIKIRLYLGGEAGEYLDVDRVQYMRV